MRSATDPNGSHHPLLPFEFDSPIGLLRSHAERQPDADALVWRAPDSDRRAWTYASLLDDIERVAAGLSASGVNRGDFVCVHSNNRPEFILTWFALNLLGAVMVATNTRSSEDELAYYLDKAGCVGVFAESELTPTVKGAAAQSRRCRLIVSIGSTSDVDGTSDFTELLGSRRFGGVDGSPWDVSGVQFTSGTTSRPKGVVWTNANYLWGAKLQASVEHLRPDDRHLTHLPLFHTNAQIYSVMASLWVGGAIILMPRFSARAFWPVAVEERATWSSMIPFAVKALRDQPVPDHSFRMWGGGILVPRWDERYDVQTVSWWGMTETIGQGIASDPNSEPRPLAIGLPSPAYGIRVIDDAGYEVTPPGSGLLEVKGERGLSLLLEYLNDPVATADAFTSDGWFKTGDRVQVHGDGWISFLERDKDMLKVGAENVAALEVERVISRVRGVDEVAVVARPHVMLDEVPVAFVVALAGTDAEELERNIRAECEGHLADFKRPVSIHVVPDLPRSTIEKVAKNVLRQWAVQRDSPATSTD